MAGFGGYDSVRELHQSGAKSVWTARPQGSTDSPAFAIKFLEPDDSALTPQQKRKQIERFLDRAEVQKKAVGKGGHWVRVHEYGKTDTGAALVTDYYRRSIQTLIDAKVSLSNAALYRIVRSIVAGLRELNIACGRVHGNLRPQAILIAGNKSVAKSRIVLNSPATTADVEGRASAESDFPALGAILYELITGSPFARSQLPIQDAPAWKRLGKKAEAWRRLCTDLLSPDSDAAPKDLDQVFIRVRAVKPPRRIWPLVLFASTTAAAILIVVSLTLRRESDPVAWKNLCLDYYNWFAAFDSSKLPPDRHFVKIRALCDDMKQLDPKSLLEKRKIDFSGGYDDFSEWNDGLRTASKDIARGRTNLKEIKTQIQQWAPLGDTIDLRDRLAERKLDPSRGALQQLSSCAKPISLISPEDNASIKKLERLQIVDSINSISRLYPHVKGVLKEWSLFDRAAAIGGHTDPLLKVFPEFVDSQVKLAANESVERLDERLAKLVGLAASIESERGKLGNLKVAVDSKPVEGNYLLWLTRARLVTAIPDREKTVGEIQSGLLATMNPQAKAGFQKRLDDYQVAYDTIIKENWKPDPQWQTKLMEFATDHGGKLNDLDKEIAAYNDDTSDKRSRWLADQMRMPPIDRPLIQLAWAGLLKRCIQPGPRPPWALTEQLDKLRQNILEMCARLTGPNNESAPWLGDLQSVYDQTLDSNLAALLAKATPASLSSLNLGNLRISAVAIATHCFAIQKALGELRTWTEPVNGSSLEGHVADIGKLPESAGLVRASEVEKLLKDADQVREVEGWDETKLAAEGESLARNVAEFTPGQRARLFAIWTKLGKFPSWPTYAQLSTEILVRSRFHPTGVPGRRGAEVIKILDDQGVTRLERAAGSALATGASIPENLSIVSNQLSMDDLSALSPKNDWLRYDLLVAKLRNELSEKRLRNEKSIEFIDAFKQQLGRFKEARFVISVDALRKEIEDKVKETDQRETQKSNDEFGPPSSSGWVKSEIENPEGYVFTRRDQRLVFLYLDIGKSQEASYICTTEVSLGLFLEIIDDDWKERPQTVDGLKWGKLTRNVGGGDVNEFDLRTWAWKPDQPKMVNLCEYWVLPTADDEQVRKPFWVGVDQSPRPNINCPMNRIPALSAEIFAKMLRCKLPSLEEWIAATKLSPKAAQGGKILDNVRDLKLKTQVEHWVLNEFRSHAAVILSGFQECGFERLASLSFDPRDDGTIFFRAVPTLDGKDFQVHDLIGNVAEWVTLGTWDDQKPKYGIIGGSAISDPDVSEDQKDYYTPLEQPQASNPSPSDVGIRLAFTASRPTLASNVRELLNARAFVPPDSPSHP